MLVGLLHGLLPSSVIVATSVYQRLTTIAAEGLMALVVSHRLRPTRLAAVRAASDAAEPADAAGETEGTSDAADG